MNFPTGYVWQLCLSNNIELSKKKLTYLQLPHYTFEKCNECMIAAIIMKTYACNMPHNIHNTFPFKFFWKSLHAFKRFEIVNIIEFDNIFTFTSDLDLYVLVIQYLFIHLHTQTNNQIWMQHSRQEVFAATLPNLYNCIILRVFFV